MKFLKRLLPIHILLFLFLIIPIQSTSAQVFKGGLKLGANYSVGDEGSEVFGRLGSFQADSKPGFYFGAFAEAKLNKFLLRPELLYNHVSGEFIFPNQTSVYTIDKISIPILVGYEILENVDIYAGPSFQFLVNSNFENVTGGFEQYMNVLAGQAGIKVTLRKIEVDIRYDFTFATEDSQNMTIQNTMTNAFFDDGRLNNIMLGIGFNIFDGNQYRVQSHGGGCYF